ncbi:hypothetical protein GCM10027297_16620 [Parahaliea aestuarii]
MGRAAIGRAAIGRAALGRAALGCMSLECSVPGPPTSPAIALFPGYRIKLYARRVLRGCEELISDSGLKACAM